MKPLTLILSGSLFLVLISLGELLVVHSVMEPQCERTCSHHDLEYVGVFREPGVKNGSLIPDICRCEPSPTAVANPSSTTERANVDAGFWFNAAPVFAFVAKVSLAFLAFFLILSFGQRGRQKRASQSQESRLAPVRRVAPDEKNG